MPEGDHVETPDPEEEREVEVVIKIRSFGKERQIPTLLHFLMQALHREFGADHIKAWWVPTPEPREGDETWRRLVFDPLIREGGELNIR